jgi:hypothetical protein
VTSTGTRHSDRLLWILAAATLLCYAIGYPLALIGGSSVGWVFVTLGGPLLIAVLVLLIRRYGR